MIKVLFFAGLRELAGANSIDVSAEGVANVRDLVRVFSAQLPAELNLALQDETAMVSIDQRYAGWDAQVHDGAEVGFLPPVSGG